MCDIWSATASRLFEYVYSIEEYIEGSRVIQVLLKCVIPVVCLNYKVG